MDNFLFCQNNDADGGNVDLGDEVVRITAAGLVALGGAIALSGDTAAANQLDDYEEGTWTPTIKFGATACTITSGLTNKYTKVGNLVHCVFTFATTNLNGGTGALEMGGLPFANASAFSYGHLTVSPATLASGQAYVQVFVNAAATAFFIIQGQTGTSTFDHNDGTTSSNFYGSVTYYV